MELLLYYLYVRYLILSSGYYFYFVIFTGDLITYARLSYGSRLRGRY